MPRRHTCFRLELRVTQPSKSRSSPLDPRTRVVWSPPCYGRCVSLEDAAGHDPVCEHIEVILIPLARGRLTDARFRISTDMSGPSVIQPELAPLGKTFAHFFAREGHLAFPL